MSDYLSGKNETESVPPEPRGFMANIDAALEQKILYSPSLGPIPETVSNAD
jgi:hypothetical protein